MIGDLVEPLKAHDHSEGSFNEDKLEGAENGSTDCRQGESRCSRSAVVHVTQQKREEIQFVQHKRSDLI